MSLTTFLKLYLLAVPIFFLIDMVWLALIARGFYRSQLGDLLSSNINWLAAIAFYFLFIVGIIIFAVAPAIGEDSVMTALLYGALFGLISYATYDLTNLATTKDWPFTLTFVDMAWGTFLSASVSSTTFLLAKQLNLF